MKIVHPSQGGPGTTQHRTRGEGSSPTNIDNAGIRRRLEADTTGLLTLLADVAQHIALPPDEVATIRSLATVEFLTVVNVLSWFMLVWGRAVSRSARRLLS